MARADIQTILPLDRFARIFGIQPLAFNQAESTNFPVLDCGDIWFQYQWQNDDAVSREDLALAISIAEKEIAEFLGYWPGPKWLEQEAHQYPKYYRPNVISYAGLNVTGCKNKSITANYGKIISAGQRATTLIGTATTAGGTLAYSDPDGDGLSELATITLTTTETNECEVKVYFANKNAVQTWEIRPAKSVTISGGTVTITLDSWLLINPDLWDELNANPDDALRAINLQGTISNYVTSVDVYREYTDTTATSAVFYWEGGQNLAHNIINLGYCCSCNGSGCTACQLTTQNGCTHIRDVERGILVPTPASYSDANGSWSISTFTECREPDQVKIYYYSGNLSNDYLAGIGCNAISRLLEMSIAYLALARLERPFCGSNCNNLGALQKLLRRDVTEISTDGSTFQTTPEMLSNPFGTTKAEIQVWNWLKHFSNKRLFGSATIV